MLAFTRATCLGATRKLGLSFSKAADYDKENLSVVPPLLRDEALKIQRSKGNYMTGYIINAGFSDSVMQWHAHHRDISLHFFWDKKDADETTQIDDALTIRNFYIIWPIVRLMRQLVALNRYAKPCIWVSLR